MRVSSTYLIQCFTTHRMFVHVYLNIGCDFTAHRMFVHVYVNIGCDFTTHRMFVHVYVNIGCDLSKGSEDECL